MTCIAVLRQDNKIVMGGDSAISKEESDDFLISNTPKVYVIDGELFGAAGAWRFINLISTIKTLPEGDRKQETDYAINHVMPHLKNVLKKGGALRSESDLISLPDSELVFTVGEKIFIMDVDFSIVELKQDFAAVGSGWRAAMSSLYTSEFLNMLPDPTKRINTALKAASEYCSGVHGPFTIISKVLA